MNALLGSIGRAFRASSTTLFRRHAKIAFIAAVLGAFVAYITNPTQATTLPGLIFGAFIGFLVGWLFDLCRELTTAAERLAELNGTFLSYLDQFLRRDPYSLFISNSPHTGIIGKLVARSLPFGYKRISGVHENDYLAVLREAIAASATFEGVQRHAIRWFVSDDADAESEERHAAKNRYLAVLKEKQMELKRRVFVIRDQDMPAMRADLEDKRLLGKYWDVTGTDVETYWIADTALRSHYQEIRTTRDFEDCAVYDGHLMIRYDEDRRMLHFDLVSPGEPARYVLDRLQEQISVGGQEPFRELAAPEKQQKWPAMLRVYGNRDEAYDRFLDSIKGLPVQRVDCLQFSGFNLVPLLKKLVSKWPAAQVRVLIMDPNMASAYDGGKPDYQRDRIRTFIREVEDSRERGLTVDLRYYQTPPSLAAIIVDDSLINVSWYRCRSSESSHTLMLEGHTSGAISAGGEDAAPLVSFARTHFEAVWKTARVEVDANKGIHGGGPV